MYFSDVLRLIFRRWLVVLVGIVATLAASFYVVNQVPTQYESEAQLLLLLPPDATGVTTPTNPYLNLQEGLITTASLIASNEMASSMAAELATDGLTAKYSVAILPGTGPLLLVTATDPDPAVAAATRDRLIQKANDNLRQMQTSVDVPERQLIYSRTASITKEPQALHGSKLRALIGTGAVGGLITLIVAFAVDRTAGRRRGRGDGGNGASRLSDVTLRNALQIKKLDRDDAPQPVVGKEMSSRRPRSLAARTRTPAVRSTAPAVDGPLDARTS